MRKRLKPHEAEYIGFIPKPKEGIRNPRYSISKDQWDKVQIFRNNISKTEIEEIESETQNPFTLSAWSSDGKLLDIDEYCEKYNLPIENVRSYKLVSHTGIPFYNIQFKEESINTVDWNVIKNLIEDDLKSIKLKPIKGDGERIGVATIADLHFGAYVDGLIRTKEFSIDILCNKLYKAAQKINRYGFKEVYINFLGDLIESFTGLNHRNSWKSLDKKMIGAEAVKLATKCMHEYLLKHIKNLKSITIVAGNHDRTTSDKDEDVDGGAANLIAWGLDLIGYNVEFNPLVISREIDGINYISLHGDKGISKKDTTTIIWNYGKQGMYNFVLEGHLHTWIEKLTKKYQTIKDDSIDHRRMHCPSFFTGNAFSENLGYVSNSGFLISYNDGEGVPEVDYKTV